MNTNWLDLIQQYISGTIRDDQAVALEERLKCDTDLRDAYLDALNLDSALETAAQSAETAVSLPILPSVQTLSTASHRKSWLSRRPLAAAAAGVVIGLFSASVVWAVSGATWGRAVVSRRVPVADFEKVVANFPHEIGIWGGDQAEIVAEEGKARELRFIKAELAPSSPFSEATTCDVFHVVDLEPFRRNGVDMSPVLLELNADMRDARPEPGTPVRLIARVYVFAEQPREPPSPWLGEMFDALGSGAYSVDSPGGSPDTWQTVRLSCVVPPQARYAVLQLAAGSRKGTDGSAPNFGQQFARNVRINLQIHPSQ